MQQAQIRVHMHPALISMISNSITDAGSGSDLQYVEFTTGDVPMILGVKVISNIFMKINEAAILPLNMIGTPDVAVMTTNIYASTDMKGMDVLYGNHYFDAVLVQPELVTLIEFPSDAPLK
jgi:hypothetical protein